MSITQPNLHAESIRVVVVGDGGSALAGILRGLGHSVQELPPSDFHGLEEMADIVAILPGVPDAERVGAAAAACARCVWFHDGPAPRALVRLLAAAGVPVVERRDLGRECMR